MSDNIDAATSEITCVAAADLTRLIECYWRAMFDFRDCLDDIEGADGRIENLRALRWKFLAAAQAIEGALGIEIADAAAEMHRVARVLSHGLPRLGIGPQRLVERLALDDPTCSPVQLSDGMTLLGAEILASFPGKLPTALGATGQRELLQAMRAWTVAAKARQTDLGFLARRLEDFVG